MIDNNYHKEGYITPTQWKDITRGFREKNIRLTLPRRTVLDALIKNLGHPSAEEIFLYIHQTYPTIGIATVYRTLELLTKLGIVHKFEFGDGKSRYELSEDIAKKHHHHLVCIKCGQVINYTEFREKEREFLKELEDYLSKKYNFKITSHELYFYGLCSKCR
jgi:Fur family ferric uptake transcriptional regulator